MIARSSTTAIGDQRLTLAQFAYAFDRPLASTSRR